MVVPSSLETESYIGELRMLRQAYEAFRHIMADKIPDVYFISGEAGNKDENGLPDKILITPAYGCDWFQVYVKSMESWGPEW